MVKKLTRKMQNGLLTCLSMTCLLSSEKNRLQNRLTVSNIQLGTVVSDTFGKSSQKILDKILENPEDTSFDIEPLIHGTMKKKLPDLDPGKNLSGYPKPDAICEITVEQAILMAQFQGYKIKSATE